MNMNGMDDNKLIKGCMEGDHECFRKIVKRYTGKAMALALNILKNRQDAEDACQETFIQIFHNLQGFDFHKKFKDWFYAILYHRCIDMVRKKRRFYRFVSQKNYEPPGKQQAPDDVDMKLKKLPQHYLENLSAKEKTALLLWAQEEYKSKEIGEIMKCSPSTARVYLYKARKKIKSLMEDQNDSLQNS
jgi:RNA polymerase sigma-70 factor (ECF subfamily)